MSDQFGVTTPTEVTPAYTPTPTPTATPSQATPTAQQPASYPTQNSPYALAVHVLELSLVYHRNSLAQMGISNPLSHPSRTTGLPPQLYDAIKKFAIKLLRDRPPVAFGYETVKGVRYVVRSEGVRQSAISYIDRAIRSWGYVRASAGQPVTPTATPVYTPPEPEPVYTPPTPSPEYTPPSPTPVYTEPAPSPEYTEPAPTPVYAPPSPEPVYAPPEPEPVYAPPVPEPEPDYPTQNSAYRLAYDTIGLALQHFAPALLQLGVSDTTETPSSTVSLSEQLYGEILRHAAGMLKAVEVPFEYQDVDGQKFVVKSSAVQRGTINYLETALKSWGYRKSEADLPVVTQEEVAPKFISPEPLIIPSPGIAPDMPDIPPVVTQEPYIPPFVTPEPDVITYPDIMDEIIPLITEDIVVTEPIDEAFDEGMAVKWAVSYSLLQHGFSSYPLITEKARVTVDRQVYESLIVTASNVAAAMVAQGTYRPQL